MKSITFLVLGLFVNLSLWAQISECSCAWPGIQMEENELKAYVDNCGVLYFNPNGVHGFEAPKGSNKNAFCASSLWLGGQDDFGELRLAAAAYDELKGDYIPGPIVPGDKEICLDFDMQFRVEGYAIQSFIQKFEFQKGEIDLEDIPESILQWPGRNNPYFDLFELPEDIELAPFFDVMGDGIYDPTEGDHPSIDPEIACHWADEMVWWVMNDETEHKHTSTEAAGIEIGVLSYAFDSPNYLLAHSTYVQYTIRNKGKWNYDDFYFGIFLDFLLGEMSNDVMGCLPAENMAYVYQGSFPDAGSEGYGDETVLLGTKILEAPKPDSEDHLVNSFVNMNYDYTVHGYPEKPVEYINVMKGLRRNGDPMFPFDNGFNASTNFFQEGNPKDWPYDVKSSTSRGLLSIHPKELKSGDEFQVSLVSYFTAEHDYSNPNPDLSDFFKDAQSLQEDFDYPVSKECLEGYVSINQLIGNSISDIIVQTCISSELNLKDSPLYSSLSSGRLELIDLNGRSVYLNNINSGQLNYSIPTISSGVYMLQLKDGSKVVGQQKVVKM